MKEDQKKKKEPGAVRQALNAYLFLSGIGIYFCVVLGICIYLGHLADEHFALGSKGKIIGILVGFPLAVYSIYRRIKEVGEKN